MYAHFLNTSELSKAIVEESTSLIKYTIKYILPKENKDMIINIRSHRITRNIWYELFLTHQLPPSIFSQFAGWRIGQYFGVDHYAFYIASCNFSYDINYDRLDHSKVEQYRNTYNTEFIRAIYLMDMFKLGVVI